MRERLLRLVTRKDQGAAVPPDDVQASIDAFYAAVPEWASPAMSRVFFRDIVPGSVVYRVQLSGNCYMHAPAVVAHYVVCKNNPGDASKLKEVVDLTAHVLKYFNGEELWYGVHTASGGDAKGFLEDITGVRENNGDFVELRPTNGDVTAEAVVEQFDTHGPAMVARIQAFDAFTAPEPAVHSWIGHRHDKKTGQHAMALVGHRTTAEGEIVFLVQDWEKKRQLFECDLAFLHSRSAMLLRITAPLKELPAEFARTHVEYEESYLTGDDRGYGPRDRYQWE